MTRVISKAALLIFVLTKSHDPPSGLRFRGRGKRNLEPRPLLEGFSL